MREPRRSIAGWVLALFVCTAAGPAVPGFALCVGDDGHVTVEAAHGSAPCDTHLEQHRVPSAAPTALDGSPEHGCVDTVLTPPRGERPRDPSASLGAESVAQAVAARPASPSRIVASGRNATVDRGASPRMLATTKLRI